MCKPWANFLNAPDEEHYIPWTDCCPYCQEAVPIGWEGYIHEKGSVSFDVFYCTNCEVVFNFGEDDPKATVIWLTETEANDRGLTILQEESENMQ